MLKVMFLCTGNACRSQMAEGIAREFGKGIIEPFSAGILAAGVHPRAVAVMEEIGVDISHQESKTMDENFLKTMDVIITLCGNAEHACPRTPPEIRRIHWPINDPVGTMGREETIMKAFRRTRDEIWVKTEQFIAGIKGKGK